MAVLVAGGDSDGNAGYGRAAAGEDNVIVTVIILGVRVVRGSRDSGGG